MITHPIPPLFNENSRILILGSFPSVKSREVEFFYGHPQNRFWKVLAGVFETTVPLSVEDKRGFLLSHNIAVWDVIESCEITGSADSSIKNVKANDLSAILNKCNIQQIFVNGRTSQKLYRNHIEEIVGRKAVYMPSTSPANAQYSLEDLINKWKIIKNILKTNYIPVI